jgi:hypothetical protein
MWPRAGIGRQSGLKIQWDLFPWRFESARGYQKPTINQRFVIKRNWFVYVFEIFVNM